MEIIVDRLPGSGRPIVVARSVYDAAERVAKEAAQWGVEGRWLAAWKTEWCRRRRDECGIGLWYAVCQYHVEIAVSPRASVNVLPDSPWERERAEEATEPEYCGRFRPRIRRPRRDTGSRRR